MSDPIILIDGKEIEEIAAERDAALAEASRQDLEIAALTERFVPLVEQNERLRAALRWAADFAYREAAKPAQIDGEAALAEIVTKARAALSHSAATGEGK